MMHMYMMYIYIYIIRRGQTKVSKLCVPDNYRRFHDRRHQIFTHATSEATATLSVTAKICKALRFPL
jgi:hypothetical protein